MYKGCQKKMIMLKGVDSAIFEEAYFILKPGAENKSFSEDDMVKEANRIIENNLITNYWKKSKSKKADKKFRLTLYAIAFAGLLITLLSFII